MSTLFLALGLVLVVEGLVLALAPLRMEDVLRLLSRLTPEQRRMVGLAAIAAGVGIVAIARRFGA